MDCVIMVKGQSQILYLIKDCVLEKEHTVEGRGSSLTLIGSNMKIVGLKANLYDLIWTNDTIMEIGKDVHNNILYDKEKHHLTSVPKYDSIPVGSREDVDTITKNKIRGLFSVEDELQILREKLNYSDSEKGREYMCQVESIVAEGKSFKDSHFPKKEQ